MAMDSLRVVEQISQIRVSTANSMSCLQSEDIQRFIPHQVLISAGAIFHDQRLQRDVIPPSPGCAPGMLNHCTMDDILQPLTTLVVDGRQQYCSTAVNGARLEYSDCNCPLHKVLAGQWSMLVHGLPMCVTAKSACVFVLHADAIAKGCVDRFRLLVDP